MEYSEEDTVLHIQKTLKSAYIEILGFLDASHTVYVYDTELFISYFVSSICAINVLRFENHFESLESAFFSFKIRVLIVQERIR